MSTNRLQDKDMEIGVGAIMRSLFVPVGVVLIFASSFVVAQDVPLLRGRILDKSTKDPISGANIIVRREKLGTMSDSSGYFRLVLPDTRPRVVTFSHVGHLKVSQSVVFDSTSELRFRLFMEPDTIRLPEFLVSGKRRIVITEAAQRRALFTINGDEFEKLGEEDMAKVLHHFFPFQIASSRGLHQPTDDFTLYVDGGWVPSEYVHNIDPFSVTKVMLWDMVGIDRDKPWGRKDALGGIDLFPLGMPLVTGKYVIAIETKPSR